MYPPSLEQGPTASPGASPDDRQRSHPLGHLRVADAGSRPSIVFTGYLMCPRCTTSVGVEVESGVVTYTGSITDERLRQGLKVIAENTAGCLAVHDHMAWIEPNSGTFMPSPEDEEKQS